MDKSIHSEHSTSSNILLTGFILLANLDFNGMLDYGIKALMGGGIWFGYKLMADYLDRKRKSRR